MAKKYSYAPVMLDTARIKLLREAAGLTQDQAAKEVKKSGRQWWNNIESGKQTNIQLDTLNEIAKVLKIPAKELLK